MKTFARLFIYLFGLFVCAFGVNLALKSNLGITPVSALNLSLSHVSGLSLGTVTFGVYLLYVLAQIALLGRRFKLKNLLQTVFGFAFGAFLDLTGLFLKGIAVQGYALQLAWMAAGILVSSFGAMLFISMDVVPNAPDGLVLAIAERTGKGFPNTKLVFDCACMTLAVVVSLAILGRLTSVREGTLLSALLTGKLIGLFAKPCAPWLQKMAFAEGQQTALSMG